MFNEPIVHWYPNIFSHVPSTKVREIAAMLKAIDASEDIVAAREKAVHAFIDEPVKIGPILTGPVKFERISRKVTIQNREGFYPCYTDLHNAQRSSLFALSTSWPGLTRTNLKIGIRRFCASWRMNCYLSAWLDSVRPKPESCASAISACELLGFRVGVGPGYLARIGNWASDQQIAVFVDLQPGMCSIM